MSLEELAERARQPFVFPEYANPNSIIVVGDVHGHTGTYQKFIKKLPPGQRSIQIGDMGIGFNGVGLHEMPSTHRWFRGNHDNPMKCRMHSNYLGDYGYQSQDRLFWLAGAFSIDRAMRVQGVSYWTDEELSYPELEKAIQLYKETLPRFVLSHETPVHAAHALLGGLLGSYFAAKGECANSRTSQALQIMLDFHQPEKWVFGHYHVDKSFFVDGYKTEFICVGGMLTSGEAPHTYELNLEGA
jgi:hypothetical protein